MFSLTFKSILHAYFLKLFKTVNSVKTQTNRAYLYYNYFKEAF